jgi:AcrR family transcriptional regulator
MSADLIAPAAEADPAVPRRPERANGRRRYELLLDAAERLLAREQAAGLTIQKLAHEAGVPMASVYHFFPGPAAISVALSERYMTGFAELVGRPIPDRAALAWPAIIETLWARSVQFYREHPYAQTLVLGSDHSWQIRRLDLANNRAIADAAAALIADKFPPQPPELLREVIVVGISIGDAVLTLSIAEQGSITEHYAREAVIAVCGYLARKLTPDAG